MLKKIKVFIIDDSASVRKVLTGLLSSDPEIDVIAASSNPVIAKKILNDNWPDVFILDIEMPMMDGITFLKEIMATRPTPVVVCSSFAKKNLHYSINAMSSGAVGVINKPQIGINEFLLESAMTIIDTVKSAAQADLKIMNLKNARSFEVEPKLSADAILAPWDGTRIKNETSKIVAIGASMGGTKAIEQTLKSLPKSSPGIAIVQHMPENFTYAFAERLKKLTKLDVKEAKNGDLIEPGVVLIAPGNKHLLVDLEKNNYVAKIKDGPLISRHRPSVDVLFRSVSKCAGKNALGIIMTGMGDDGAAGMLEMKKSGVKTIAEDQATAVIFGMPKEAIKRGGVDIILPLHQIPKAIIDFYIS